MAPFIQKLVFKINGQNGWVFDSRATSIVIDNFSDFKCMDCYTGLLKIASGTQIPIKKKDIVYVILSNSQEVCLGDVIYILGLVERLLSLEVLYITRFKSRGTAAGYQLLKDNKVVV